MLKLMKSLFAGTPSAKSPENTKIAVRKDYMIHEITGDEVPRYPPFIRGLPVIEADRILATQDDLIKKIKHTLAIEPEEFEQIVLPIIKNFARFVHLLPASETHHHRGAGGLFRHSLEVASNCARLAEGRVFAYGKPPRERKEEEPKWRVAAFAAGLTHDIGKAATDMAVVNMEGDLQWQPYLCSLEKWGLTNGVDRYFIRWRENRHKNHEQSGLLLTNQVLTDDFKAWIGTRDPEIIRVMLEASACRGEHPLSVMVKNGDSASVEKDLRQSHASGGEMAVGVPVERHILDAARRLISKGDWTANKKGSRVWVTKQGVFIAWSQAAREITELLYSDKVPGIPRDPDTLADLLLDRDIAKENDVEDAANPRRYWQVAPAVLEGRKGPMYLRCLKLSSVELLFNYDPPGYASVNIKGHEEEIIEVLGDDPTNAEMANSAEDADTGKESGPLDRGPEAKEATRPNPGKKGFPRMPEASQPEAIPAQLSGKPGEGPVDEEQLNLGIEEPEQPPKPELDGPSEALNAAREWLNDRSQEVQDLLNKIISDLRHQQVRVEGVFSIEDGLTYLRYPGAVRPYGKPADILGALSEQELIVANPDNPTRKVHDIDEGKGLLFQADAAEHIRILLNEGCEPLTTDELRASLDERKGNKDIETHHRESKRESPAGRSSSNEPEDTAGKSASKGTEDRPPKIERAIPHELVKTMNDFVVRVRSGEVRKKGVSSDGRWAKIATMHVAKESGEFGSSLALEALGKRTDVEVKGSEIWVNIE